MDLVDEEHGPLSERTRALRVGNHRAQIGDAGAHGRNRDELRFGRARDHFRKRGLSRAGWAPEDHRRHRIVLDRTPQRATLADDVFLTDVLGERPRPHPRGERRGSFRLEKSDVRSA
jgi:hypothetical protein